MSIKHNDHCSCGVPWEKDMDQFGCWNCGAMAAAPRKTFLGMTAVSWYLLLYIAVVLVAIAWIVTARVPGGT